MQPSATRTSGSHRPVAHGPHRWICRQPRYEIDYDSDPALESKTTDKTLRLKLGYEFLAGAHGRGARAINLACRCSRHSPPPPIAARAAADDRRKGCGAAAGTTALGPSARLGRRGSPAALRRCVPVSLADCARRGGLRAEIGGSRQLNTCDLPIRKKADHALARSAPP